jgi:uncharacterized protein (DUF433 family)
MENCDRRARGLIRHPYRCAVILKDYPRLQRADVLAAIAYAREVLGADEVISRRAA